MDFVYRRYKTSPIMAEEKSKKLPIIVEDTQENEPLIKPHKSKILILSESVTSTDSGKQKSSFPVSDKQPSKSDQQDLLPHAPDHGNRLTPQKPVSEDHEEVQPTLALIDVGIPSPTPSTTNNPEVASFAAAMFGLATDAVMPLESELSFATGTPSKVLVDGLNPPSALTISDVSIITVGGAAAMPTNQADHLSGDGSSVSDMSLDPASASHAFLHSAVERLPSPTGSRSEASFTESTLENVTSRPPLPSTGHLYEHMYVQYCERLHVVPISHFLRHMHETKLVIKHRGLKPLELKALATLLVPNSTITVLDLEDNWIEEQGLTYIGDLLRENFYITELNLANNKLGCSSRCLANLSEIMLYSTIQRLDISGNKLLDSHGVYISKIINEGNLKYLNVSHNELGNMTGSSMGTAIAENICMEELDISWNCFRGKAGVDLVNGITNSHLRAVNLAWNGLADAGAERLARLIAANNILRELSATSNRFTAKGTDLLAKAVKDNETLIVLRLGRNSWSKEGTLTLLSNILYNPNSTMKELDLEDVHVSPEFLKLQELAKSLRTTINVKHKFMASKYLKCGV